MANRYISALEKAFNVGKDKRVRQKSTHRPYLYIDNFRDELVKRKIGHTGKTPEDFVKFAKQKNEEGLLVLKTKEKREAMEERALALEFSLAMDTKYKWLAEFE